MKRIISMLLSFILAVCLLQGTVVSAASNSGGNAQPLTAEDLPEIFASDSYWKMTAYNYQTPVQIVGEYYVRLAREMFTYVEIVNAEGDDWRFDRPGWEYDYSGEHLEINLLKSPWNDGVFLLESGSLVTYGTYRKMVLTRESDAKSKFEQCRSSFEKQYGGINPVKWLLKPDDVCGYLSISDWDTVPYDNFRNSVNNKIRGLVTKPSKEEKDALWQEISSLLGKNAPPVFQMDQVLFGVQLPEKYTRQMTYTSKANIVNLVYTEAPNRASEALEAMRSQGENLLSAPATHMNFSANDTYDGLFYWNDTEAACFLRYDKSLLILQGPTPEIKAMTEYMALGDYLWKNGTSNSPTKSSQKLQPGQTVTIGHYHKASDGITWQVLDVQGDQALLIAQKGLDVQPYNTKYGSVTWETSSLRDWLNTTFLNGAFTAEEQKAIRTTYVDNGKAQGCDLWNTDGGNNTQDNIFLLSYAEAKKYFDIATPGIDGPEKARIQPTKYAADQGAYVSEEFKTADGKDATRWWLRSPGCNQLDAACVHSRGCVGEQMCSSKDTCVRPAMWVDLNKIK